MANSKQAAKRARQALKHQEQNRWQRSRAFTEVKRVTSLVEEKNAAEATKVYPLACSLLDRLAVKGLIHKNKASRLKSRMNLSIKKLAA